MNTAQERIYRPGTRPLVIAQTQPDTRPSGAAAAIADHPGADAGEAVKPFPLDRLPPAAAMIAAAIARTERTPEALAACCTLGILSASIGAGLQVKSGPDRATRGNLYLLASA